MRVDAENVFITILIIVVASYILDLMRAISKYVLLFILIIVAWYGLLRIVYAHTYSITTMSFQTYWMR